MEISITALKELRQKTGAGVMDCKRALTEAQGSLEGAMDILRRQGLALAEKKAQRATTQGLVESYVHAGGRIGALVEVNCETDFVARTEIFQALAHDLAMQVAAMNPAWLGPEDAPPGKNDLDPQQACLLLQPFIRDPGKTVQDLIRDAVARLGENIRVRRFARFELGG